MVSKEFAELNKLKLGDSIVVKNSMNQKESLSLKLVGIYFDSSPQSQELPPGVIDLGGSSSNTRNELLVGLDTLLDGFTLDSFGIPASYELSSPDVLEAFSKELTEKGLPSEYIVQTDVGSYERIVAPVEGLAKISLTFIAVILAVGSIILLFVITMTTRERKYEIGVLRALGMKKAKVATMLVFESIIISTIALTLAFGMGMLVAQPVADKLIQAQIESRNENNMDMNGIIQMESVGVGSIGQDERSITEIKVKLTTNTMAQISVVALLLAGRLQLLE